MRLSRPIPRASACTSASILSHRLATSLMNEILVARKAFAAYFVSSAVGMLAMTKGGLVQVQRPVEIPHDRHRGVVVGADHHSVGPQEVVDRGALAQELRVRRHAESHRPPLFLELLLDDVTHAIGGAHGHRALGNDDLVAIHRMGDFLSHLFYGTEIGGAVRSRGSLHGDEDHERRTDRGGGVRGEGEASGAHVALHELLETGLVDGHLAPVEGRNLLAVLVGADHLQSEFREAGSRHEAHVTGTDHAHIHFRTSFWVL